MLGNASIVSGVYIIERIRPEIVCAVRVIPRRNPMFHINEIDVGVGRSLKEDLAKVRRGLFFVLCVFIRMRMRLIELG